MLKQILSFSVNYKKIIVVISLGFLLMRNGIVALVSFADLRVTSGGRKPGTGSKSQAQVSVKL